MASVVVIVPAVARVVEGCAHRVSTMGIRSPVTPRMRRVRRAVPARRAIPARPAKRNVQRARDRKSHHSSSSPAAPPAMPRQIKFRRWKGNSLHDCTPPMAKTISPKITPAGHQRMPTGRGGGADCGASDDMGGVFLPIRSRQVLERSLSGYRLVLCDVETVMKFSESASPTVKIEPDIPGCGGTKTHENSRFGNRVSATFRSLRKVAGLKLAVLPDPRTRFLSG